MIAERITIQFLMLAIKQLMKMLLAGYLTLLISLLMAGSNLGACSRALIVTSDVIYRPVQLQKMFREPVNGRL